VPVVHEGNQSYSAEEVDRVAAITEILTQAGSTWTDRGGNQRPLTIDDILIVAPYNNQVNRLTDRKQNRTQEAKQAYEEALQIFREFAQKNPEAYLPDVATTLNDLGVLDRDQKRMEEARKELDETLQIRRELVQKNPEAYLPDVAETLNNMGVLDRKQNRAQEAKQAYEKALEIYEVIAKQDPQRFSADVARMKQLLVGVTEVSYGCVPAGPAKPQIKARIIETVICPRTAHGLVE
jgi:tetratricopeptide (TPR) repeat protein